MYTKKEEHTGSWEPRLDVLEESKEGTTVAVWVSGNEKWFRGEGSAEFRKIPKNFSQKGLNSIHYIDNLKLLKDLQRAFVLTSDWCYRLNCAHLKFIC